MVLGGALSFPCSVPLSSFPIFLFSLISLSPPFVAVYGPRAERGVPSVVDDPHSVEFPRLGHGLSICTPETHCASRASFMSRRRRRELSTVTDLGQIRRIR
jgi:hypothetical protein